MEYRYEAASVTGFVQQLACNYLPHGYWFFVTGRVNEATVAVLVAVLERNIEIELDYAKEADMPPEHDKCRWRRLLAGLQNKEEIEPEDVIDEQCDDMSEWTSLVESFSDGILWDGDWDLSDLFMDVEPALSRERRKQLGILPDYYVSPAPDTREEEIPRLFRSVRNLVEGSGLP